MSGEIDLEKKWRNVYASGEVLSTKLSIHDKYSSISIDITNEIKKALSLKCDESLLDIGCGTGKFLNDLWQDGHDGLLVGLDLSGSGFNREYKSDETLFIQGSGLSLPLPNSHFKFVTSLHALSHIKMIDLLMKEIKRVLVSDGSFLVTANSLANYSHVREFRDKVFEFRGWGTAKFTTDTFNAENANKILGLYWRNVETRIVKGELRIPTNVFVKYFEANIPVWDHQPNHAEKQEILDDVNIWAQKVAKNGYIIEPKWISFSVCND